MMMSKTGQKGQACIQHFKDSVEHIIFLNTKQDQNLQHQREKCAAIWLWDMESNQDNDPNATNIHWQMSEIHPENQMAR